MMLVGPFQLRVFCDFMIAMPQSLISLNMLFCGRNFPFPLAQELIPHILMLCILGAHTSHPLIEDKSLFPCLPSTFYKSDLCLLSSSCISSAFPASCDTAIKS